MIFKIPTLNPSGFMDPFQNVTDNNCSTGIQWIYHILNDCVYDNRGIASEVLGLLSIVTWMVVSIPQMVKNCRNIQGVEGISLLLILMWTLGDTANLVGAYLTKQLPLQVYLAVYFVLADLVLFGQFLYYNLWWKRKYKDYEPISGANSSNNIVNGAPPQAVLCIAGILMLGVHGSQRLLSVVDLNQDWSLSYSRNHHFGRTLLAADLGYPLHVFNNLEDTVGYAIGIVSSIFYVFSRLGQMWKNYKRKSTEGLSLMMFVLAVFGNLTYGLAILVRSLNGIYVLRHLPWLIGSLGVIFLDSSLLVQFKYYGAEDEFDKLVKEEVTSPDSEVYVTIQQPDHRGSINSPQ